MGTIYVFENIINGMKYVGKTKTKFKNRLKRHMHIPKGQETYFSNALKSYGLDNFNITLKYCSDEDLADEEIKLIRMLNSRYPSGYNLTAGGDGLLCPSDITREKMSGKNNPMFGRVSPMFGKKRLDIIGEKNPCSILNPESINIRKKISISSSGINNGMYGRIGNKNPMYGRKISEETRERMSLAVIDRYKREKHPWLGRKHSEETKNKISESLKKCNI